MRRWTGRKDMSRGIQGEERVRWSFESCTPQCLVRHISGNLFLKLWILSPAYLLPSSGTPSARLELAWRETENFSWWYYGPGLTSSSFTHQNRELADTIYSRDSWENNHSWKKLNHTPIKIAFNQCWCLIKSALKGSTKINSHCIPAHYALCTHTWMHILILKAEQVLER